MAPTETRHFTRPVSGSSASRVPRADPTTTLSEPTAGASGMASSAGKRHSSLRAPTFLLVMPTSGRDALAPKSRLLMGHGASARPAPGAGDQPREAHATLTAKRSQARRIDFPPSPVSSRGSPHPRTRRPPKILARELTGREGAGCTRPSGSRGPFDRQVIPMGSARACGGEEGRPQDLRDRAPCGILGVTPRERASPRPLSIPPPAVNPHPPEPPLFPVAGDPHPHAAGRPGDWLVDRRWRRTGRNDDGDGGRGGWGGYGSGACQEDDDQSQKERSRHDGPSPPSVS